LETGAFAEERKKNMAKVTNELTNSKTPVKTRRWTPKRRALQAERARRQKPWQKSTGPKTLAGKGISSMNAEKHGLRSQGYRDLCEALRMQRAFVRQVLSDDRDRRAAHRKAIKNYGNVPP
jgi:hypothetical protein